MNSHWTTTTWGDAIELKYGKAIRGYQDAKEKYAVYGTNGKVGSHSKYLAEGPGVILGRKGAYRGVRFSKEPFFVIDTAYFVVPKQQLDMRWLYYAMQYYRLGKIDDGSPIPSTTRAAVYTSEFKRPPIQEQQNIASFLGSLDDKIELNQQMNDTLEEMARTLFKDWFVDFGPTRRQMEGVTDPVAIMGHAFPVEKALTFAALFPSKLDENSLPEGWKKSSIYEFANVIYGAAFKSKRFNHNGLGRPLARIRDLPKNKAGQFTDESHKKEHIIQAGDVIVGMDGEFRSYLWHGVPTLMNQRVCSFAPKKIENRTLLWLAIKPLLRFFEETAIATTVIHLGKGDIDTFELVDGGGDVMSIFSSIVEPVASKIVANGQENQTLAELRDLLLPKLMSGEIRLKNEEAIR